MPFMNVTKTEKVHRTLLQGITDSLKDKDYLRVVIIKNSDST